MKKRAGCKVSVLVNMVLVAVVMVIATHEGYWGKFTRALTGAAAPAALSGHYARTVAAHRIRLAQAMDGPETRVAFIGDSTVEMWLASARVPNSINLGISGDTMAGVLARADARAIAHIPVWYLGIGVNDAIRGTDPALIPDYVAELAETFGQADTLYWRAVLPVAGDRWDDRKEVFRTALNSRIREACARMQTCVFLDAPEDYVQNFPDWSSDGIHPNVDGYRALTRQLCRHIACQPGDG